MIDPSMVNPPPTSDRALLREFCEGHSAEAAFRQVVGRYERLVFGACHRILGNVTDAEEAAQSTFVALALKARRLDASRGLGGWLYRVACQVSLDMDKTARRRKTREQETARRDEQHAAGLDRRAPDWTAALDAAITGLPPKLRLAVVQHYFEQQSLGAIAARQGCTVSAISMRLTRARGLLRDRLMRQGINEPGILDGAALVQAARSSVPPRGFAAAAVRTAAAALKGTAATTLAVAGARQMARHALRRLFLWRMRWSLASGAAAALTLAVAGAVRSHPVAADPTLPPSTVAPSAGDHGGLSAPTPPPLVPGVLPPAPARADPPLIAEIKRPLPFEALPHFKNILDATAGPIDAIRDSAGRTALHWAARGGDDEPALLLLLRGASPNAPDAAGRTPLFDALERGNKWMALLFVLAKADINHLAADGSSPLALAVRGGDLARSELLLWLGARPHVKGAAAGVQPADLAKTARDPAMARLFDEYGALRRQTFAQQPRVVPVFVKDALQDAARRGDFVRLDAFLRSGVDLNTPDDDGKTALHHAISAAQPDVVFYLLLLGANPNAPDLQGKSPLMATMGWLGGGLDTMRRFLIVKGADPFTLRRDGYTEISWAAERTNEHGMQWLLWLGANGYEANAKYGTPTQIAYRQGSQRVLDLLRRNGIDEPIKRNDDPVWNLNNAAKRGDLAVVRGLLDAGTAPDATGNSPMMNAVYGRNVAIAQFLIERGADINYRNRKDGSTPLISTMCWDYQEMTSFRGDLLRAGADPNACTTDKVTVVMRAGGHTPGTSLRQLIEAAADLNARDAKGRTMLTRTVEAGDVETADFLRQHGATE